MKYDVTPSTDGFHRFLLNLPETPEHECSYYAGRDSRLRAFLFDQGFPPHYVDVLNQCGFRRSGDLYYRTSCQGCTACLCYRVPVRSFLPSPSLKRVINRNADLEKTVGPPCTSREKEDLYVRYQYRQHFLKPVPGKREQTYDSERALETMVQQMYTGARNSLELECRCKGSLVGFAVFDLGRTTLSAVYSVYDPALARRSLGTFMILWALEWAGECGLSHVYLGYYIPGHPKMDYKKRFRPAQVLNPATHEWDPA